MFAVVTIGSPAFDRVLEVVVELEASPISSVAGIVAHTGYGHSVAGVCESAVSIYPLVSEYNFLVAVE